MTNYGRQRIPGLVDDLALPTTYFRAQIEAGALAQWKLDESSGTTMTDTSGNAYNGSYTSVTLAQASLISTTSSTSVSFPSTAFASVSSASWMNAQSMTFEGVFRTPSSLATPVCFAGRDNGTVRQWVILATSSVVDFATNGYGQLARRNTPLSGSTAYHIAGVFLDQSYVKLYLNGTEVATTSHSTSLNSGTVNLQIGRYQSTAAYFSGGRAQGCAFYGTALSAARILTHAQVAGFA